MRIAQKRLKVTSSVLLGLLVVVCCPMLVSTPAFAHHGTGISYDNNKTVAVKGTVVEFNWRNPHSQLYLDVKDDKGDTIRYGVEMNSPGVLTRQGWTRHELKPGDEVTINVHPSLAGTPVGVCENCKLSINGQEHVNKPVN